MAPVTAVVCFAPRASITAQLTVLILNMVALPEICLRLHSGIYQLQADLKVAQKQHESSSSAGILSQYYTCSASIPSSHLSLSLLSSRSNHTSLPASPTHSPEQQRVGKRVRARGARVHHFFPGECGAAPARGPARVRALSSSTRLPPARGRKA